MLLVSTRERGPTEHFLDLVPNLARRDDVKLLLLLLMVHDSIGVEVQVPGQLVQSLKLVVELELGLPERPRFVASPVGILVLHDLLDHLGRALGHVGEVQVDVAGFWFDPYVVAHVRKSNARQFVEHVVLLDLRAFSPRCFGLRHSHHDVFFSKTVPMAQTEVAMSAQTQGRERHKHVLKHPIKNRGGDPLTEL